MGDQRECREKLALLQEELELERVKAAWLQTLLELKEAEGESLPSPPATYGEAVNVLFPSKPWVPALFCQAYLDMRERDPRASNTFKAFVERYPHHPLADDALYYMAQEALRLGDRKKALALLGKLVETYPHGDRVSQAKLKIGLILVGEGRIKEGEIEIEEVLEGSPYTLGTQEAEALLKRGGR